MAMVVTVVIVIVMVVLVVVVIVVVMVVLVVVLHCGRALRTPQVTVRAAMGMRMDVPAVAVLDRELVSHGAET